MIVKIWDIKFETSLFLCQSDSHDKCVELCEYENDL